jgi:SAM-dependent methyltransferase
VGYVFDLKDARRYDDWLHRDSGRLALAIEQEALLRVWSPRPCQRVLEVGCGTGLFTQWFAEQGMQVTGLDPSPSMLDQARRRLPARVTLERGVAEELPYPDNYFDTVALITTLEFVDDPLQSLQEACRVARERVLLGVLNKYSLISWQRRLALFWSPSIYRHARFFGVLELQRLVSTALSGPVPVKWRTCLTFPLWTLTLLQSLERSRYLQWHPLGHFIAMSIDLRYILRSLQQPLFSQVPSGVGSSQPHPTCWRSPQQQTSDCRRCAHF